MRYDKENFSSYYHEMSATLRKFRLPTWEEFPDIELYMDQMTLLINRYLAIGDGGEEKAVTASMINNYVKMRIMPPPVKKKYSREHLAYLVVICSLKDALGISAIQKMFPPELEGDMLRERYDSFVMNQQKAYHFLADNIDSVALPLLEEQERVSDRIYDLVTQVSVCASITKTLAERFISKQEYDPPAEKP
ncbi:MAG: DUF1836 domain-containing protein [Oscillospiraceae bacterium]|jgi:DNA-binding transcriptional MerR regulator|nr:DUF1836 domain-containing protein [Oscillospiraceae bacterium]MBQ8011252.1 DUF1836 domain-containing protein [Oscillospiraceae bacterium]MBQ9109887.1 DUF1836 domain-containing protein [Oscillospiraceae bacterium]